jgi:hypothetical protein
MGDRLQNHNEEVEEMRKYLVIYEESYMTLQLIPSAFPYI